VSTPQSSTTQQESRRSAQLLRFAVMVWLAVLLRWLVVNLYEPGFYLAELGGYALAYYLLPALMLLTLAMILVPPLLPWRPGRALSRAGLFLLPVVGINTILRLLDLWRIHGICDDEYIRHETICDDLYLQAYCSAPFLFVGAIVLLVWPR